MSNPFFTVIIPVVSLNNYVRENINILRCQEYQNWEVYIVTNYFELNPFNDERISIIHSGKVAPGEKRDLAAQYAKGQYLIFLDDDSFPSSDYLQNLFELCHAGQIQAIGGPAVTPPTNTVWQRASGAVYESFLMPMVARRYRPLGVSKFVDDWPSVNLIVRKNVFHEVGGFGNRYWPGEDSKFCNAMLLKGYRIIYSPNLVVFHHRRSSFFAHLTQISRYGLHRGKFARQNDTNSRSFTYFAPTFIVFFFLILLVGTLFESKLAQGLFFLIAVFSILGLVVISEILLRHGWKTSLLTLLYLPSSAITYAVSFVRGYKSKKPLNSRLRE